MNGHRSFTLIEMLAVIVIASMIVAVGGVSVNAAHEHSAFACTLAGLEQLDALARLHARSDGEVAAITLNRERRQVQLVVVSSGEQLAQIDVPLTIELVLEAPRGSNRIVFDSRGLSDDYAVVVRSDASCKRVSVAGLTGDLRMEEVAQ